MKKFENSNEAKDSSVNDMDKQTTIELFKSKVEKSKKIMPQAKGKAEQIEKRQLQNGDKKEEEEEYIDELKCNYASIVLDRFFFCLEVIYALITFVGLIMSIPNFYK